MASPTWWTWVWAGSRVGDGQVSLVCCSPWDHKESDTTEQPIWTKLNWTEPPWAGWSLKTDNTDLCDLPNYLTTHQSENCAWADHIPCDPLHHTVFKNPSLKVPGEFWSFEHELPILPAWSHNTHCTFLYHTWYQYLGFAAHQMSKPKIWFSSKTLKKTNLTQSNKNWSAITWGWGGWRGSVLKGD